MSPAPLELQSLNHLGIATASVDRSKAFYRDVLGFREVERPNFNFAGSWLYNYGLTLHLIHNESAGQAGGEIQSRGNHVAMHTRDLPAVERALAEHGISYRANTIADTGIKQIFFHDPDGHTIEVGTYPATPAFLDSGKAAAAPAPRPQSGGAPAMSTKP